MIIDDIRKGKGLKPLYSGYQPQEKVEPPKPPKSDSNVSLRYEHLKDGLILGKVIGTTENGGILIELSKSGIDYIKSIE